MIIVSANHEIAVNVDRRQHFSFKRDKRSIDLCVFSQTDAYSAYSYILAKYESEERAAAVMDKVIAMLDDEEDIIDFAAL